MMVVYEIHTLHDGGWKIDSVFDDKDLAVYEASRLERSPRHPTVRVIEETFDAATDKKSTRTIYRTVRSEPPAPAKPAGKPAEPRKVTPLGVNRPAGMVKSARPISSVPRWILLGMLTVTGVFLSALGALSLLNFLTN